MEFDGKEFSRKLIARAMQCETIEELIVLAKENGAELTEEQAQAYLDEFEDFDLDSKNSNGLSVLTCYGDCDHCGDHDPDCVCDDDCPCENTFGLDYSLVKRRIYNGN